MSEPEDPGPPAESVGLITRVKTSTEIARRRALEVFERERVRNPVVRVAYSSYQRDRRFGGGVLAGGLAYRLFIFLLPFCLLIVTTLGALAEGIDGDLSDLARRAGLTASLAASVGAAVETSDRGIYVLAAFGAFFSLVAGVGVIKTMRLIRAIAWQVRPGRMARPITSSAALTGACLVLLAVRALLLQISAGLLAELVVLIAEMVAIVVVVVVSFWLLPRPEGTRWIDLIPGALLIALGFGALRLATILWFAGRLDRVDDVYGALGVATVFLAWLFIVARLLVAGVSLNATLWVGTHDEEAPAGSPEEEISTMAADAEA